MPRVKKETSVEENLSNSELAKGRSETLTISKLKKEVESLNEQTCCLQNHYEELKKNSILGEFLRICILFAGIHIMLNIIYDIRANDSLNPTNNSGVSVIEQSKHEATSDLSEIISRTKKFYYRNDSGDLIKVTGGNSDCLVATQVSITSVSAALESCFNNVAP